MADASLPVMRARSSPGMATAAMMLMMATTISSSISVKPFSSSRRTVIAPLNQGLRLSSRSRRAGGLSTAGPLLRVTTETKRLLNRRNRAASREGLPRNRFTIRRVLEDGHVLVDSEAARSRRAARDRRGRRVEPGAGSFPVAVHHRGSARSTRHQQQLVAALGDRPAGSELRRDDALATAGRRRGEE